jgi:tRNA U34 2-thiouridine synthase MnmA/TrmU
MIYYFIAYFKVVGPCLTASSAGYTPNPDALCNSRVKFHVLDAAIEEVTRVQAGREPCVPQGEGSRSRYDYIASGHYARRYPAAPPLSTQKRAAVHSDKNAAYRVPDIARKPYLSEAEERAVRTAALDLWGYDYKHDDGSTGSPPVLLLESVDPSKDQVPNSFSSSVSSHTLTLYLRTWSQTYFLSRLSQTQLQRAAFPIGHLTKAEVRAVATSGIATTQSPPMNMLDTRSGTCTTSNHSSSSHDQEEVAWVSLATARRKDSQGICFLGKIK